MEIKTKIKMNNKFSEIMSAVLGQLSDGIWENTPQMERYWKSLSYKCDENGYLIVNDKYGVCSNPIDFFANKIKQIIKIENDDGHKLTWSRDEDRTTEYLNYSESITVGDCYKLYDLLKGRDTRKYKYATYSHYKVSIGNDYSITVYAPNRYKAKESALSIIGYKMVIDLA